jgi:hypothetical protein
MSVQEIEKAVADLSSSDLKQFTKWFERYQAEIWDRQIESDVKAGKLDALIKEADEDFDSGRCRRLS